MLIAIPLRLPGTAPQNDIWSGVTPQPQCSVPCLRAVRFFPLLPLASSFDLLLPHFRHQKEVSVLATEEITLIERVSDVAGQGVDPTSLLRRSEGV